MATFELTERTAVQGYHVFKNSRQSEMNLIVGKSLTMTRLGT